MFAVVKIGGSQYRVTVGDNVVVSHLAGNVGDTITVPALLVADGGSVKLTAEAAKIPVMIKIVAHGQGEKIHIRRFRAKSRHRRHIGFRAALTTVSVESIGLPKKAKSETTSTQKTKKAV